MDNEITKYDLKYKDVTCTGVDWENLEFYLLFKGKEYKYRQKGDISCSADTDHIRYLIEEFKNDLMTKFFEEHFDR